MTIIKHQNAHLHGIVKVLLVELRAGEITAIVGNDDDASWVNLSFENPPYDQAPVVGASWYVRTRGLYGNNATLPPIPHQYKEELEATLPSYVSP